MLDLDLDLLVWCLALPTALFVLLNGFDDLLVDVAWFVRRLRRRPDRPDVQALRRLPKQRVAILVPAWQEADVIGQMIENTVLTLDYPSDRYDVFVGTYRNDPETQARVDQVAARVPNVRKVVVPHDGPTSKADCLNWIWRGVRQAELEGALRYDVLVMHDAEDVVHPLALLIYNHLIPEHDFVQTPVLPLGVPARSWVGGTYLDQFSEQHLKDLLVRDAIGGLVPSAGVGSAFARDAFEEIALAGHQQPFDPASLTEDYDIALKFRVAGKRTTFRCPIVTRTVTRGRRRVEVEEIVATREYFPTGFRAAVRQRARWIVGITLQTWAKTGWRGPAAVRYCLWRDRKALFAHPAIALGYLVALYLTTRVLHAAATGADWSFENVVPTGSLLWWLMIVNGLLLVWRIGTKARIVHRTYGLEQAVLSCPRLVVGNVVDVAATARAVVQWARHRLSGAPLAWGKTAHVFPELAALTPYPQRLTDLLTEDLATEERLVRERERIGNPAK